LQTNDVVKRRKLTKAVVTLSIIKMVHKLAELDGMPKGLKIANRANQILFDSAWIAGVDYDDALFDDEDYDDEDVEDEYYDMVEEYDEMDENELADLGEEAHGFNVPNERNRTEQQPVFNNEEEEHVFEEPNDDHASDEEYKDSDESDESLDADAEEEDTKEDTNPSLR
jgi:hypothetical protein